MKTIFNSLFWIVIAILILLCNTVYSFLPQELQNIPLIQYFGIGVALTIFSYGSYKIVLEYKNRIFAHISHDGNIITSNKFPWKVTKRNYYEKQSVIIYVLNECYVDVTRISIDLDKPNNESLKHQLFFGVDGVFIEFHCAEDKISNFKIKINY